MRQNSLDFAVLAFVKGYGCEIKASLKRLYESGDITPAELADCVGRLISLDEYNEITGIA